MVDVIASSVVVDRSRELELSSGVNKLYFMRSDNIDLRDITPSDLGVVLTLLRTIFTKRKKQA
jgi:hypothetical protein